MKHDQKASLPLKEYESENIQDESQWPQLPFGSNLARVTGGESEVKRKWSKLGPHLQRWAVIASS